MVQRDGLGEEYGPMSVSGSLPRCFQNVFNFRYFNSVQSECFDVLYNSRKNTMVSSPTGSGKVRDARLMMIMMHWNYQSIQFICRRVCSS